jgi:PII interaction protein X
MTGENYINHPNFGLLYRVCPVDDNQELFTTLYAQRLFFLVTHGPKGIRFEPLGRSDARLMVEMRLRQFRRLGQTADYQKLQEIHKNTFQ